MSGSTKSSAHAVEYYVTLKRKQLLSHATKRMLSEINQSQKDKTVWFHLYEASEAVKLVKTQSTMQVARGQGEGAKRVVEWPSSFSSAR